MTAATTTSTCVEGGHTDTAQQRLVLLYPTDSAQLEGPSNSARTLSPIMTEATTILLQHVWRVATLTLLLRPH